MISRRMLFIAVPVLWLAALGSAAGAIYCKHRARTLFIELEALNGRRDNLEIEWGQLQLEQSAWSTHAFVERVASTKLTASVQSVRLLRLIRWRAPRNFRAAANSRLSRSNRLSTLLNPNTPSSKWSLIVPNPTLRKHKH